MKLNSPFLYSLIGSLPKRVNILEDIIQNFSDDYHFICMTSQSTYDSIFTLLKKKSVKFDYFNSKVIKNLKRYINKCMVKKRTTKIILILESTKSNLDIEYNPYLNWLIDNKLINIIYSGFCTCSITNNFLDKTDYVYVTNNAMNRRVYRIFFKDYFDDIKELQDNYKDIILDRNSKEYYNYTPVPKL